MLTQGMHAIGNIRRVAWVSALTHDFARNAAFAKTRRFVQTIAAHEGESPPENLEVEKFAHGH